MKYGLHDVSQALFSLGTCIVDGTCSCKKTNQHNFAMTPDLKQNHPKCRLSSHRERWHPWSTIIFWYAKKTSMGGSLTPSPWTLHHSKLSSHTRQKSHLAPPTLLECLKKNIRELWAQENADLDGTRSYVKLTRFQVGTSTSPYSRKCDSRTF